MFKVGHETVGYIFNLFSPQSKSMSIKLRFHIANKNLPLPYKLHWFSVKHKKLSGVHKYTTNYLVFKNYELEKNSWQKYLNNLNSSTVNCDGIRMIIVEISKAIAFISFNNGTSKESLNYIYF